MDILTKIEYILQEYKSIFLTVITNQKFKFSEIDYKFYNSFLEYFRSIEKINDNTIGSYIKILKYWLKVAEIEGVSVNPYYKHNDFAAPSLNVE